MDRDSKIIAVALAVVTALFAASCVFSVMTKQTETAVIEGFITLVCFGIFFAWCRFNRHSKIVK